MIVLLPFGGAKGQQIVERASPFVSFYGPNEGLPGNEIYDLEMDSLGRLWICSNNGALRYNGIEFERYDHESTSRSVIGATKDAQGQIWFWTVRGEVLKYNAQSDQLLKMYPNEDLTVPINKVITDVLVTQDRVYLASDYFLIELGLDAEGKVVSIETSKSFRGEINLHLFKEGAIAVGDRTNWKPIAALNVYRDGLLEKEVDLSIVSSSQRTNHGRFRCITSGQQLYMQCFSNLVSMNMETFEIGFVRKFDFLTPSIEYIDGEVFTGQMLQGAVAVNVYDGAYRPIPADGTSITSFESDHLGNVWMGTLEAGLAQYSGSLMHFQPRREFVNIEDAWTFRKDLIFVTEKGGFYRISKEGDGFKLELMRSFGTLLGKPEMVREEVYVSTLEGDYAYDFEADQWKVDVSLPRYPLKPFVAKWGNFLAYNDSTGQHDTLRKGIDYGRIRRHFRMNHRSTYTGNFSYTFYYDRLEKRLTGLQPDSAYDVRCAVHLGHDTCILGTAKWGLILTHKEHVIGHLQMDRSNLEEVSYLVKHKGKIWATSPTGLFSIESIENGVVHPHYWNDVLHIGKCNINGLYTWGDLLVLNCSKGLLVFDPTKLNPGSLHPEIIDFKVVTDDTTYASVTGEIPMSYKKSSFTIQPKAMVPLGKTAVNYRYQIRSLDSSWRTQTGGQIDIAALPVGKHQIAVSAQNQLGTWSSRAKLLSVNVKPPFWATKFFIVLVVVVSLLLVWLGLSLRVKRIKTQAGLEMKIVEAQNKALSLQLNPHFVFNSLNSVIASITQNNKKTALSYLSNFAKLMRNIFEHSQFPLIPLEEEIEAIRHFVKLESDRLDHSFEFQLHIQDGFQPARFMIPPLVLQPIVENAIWHGVIPLTERKGLIQMTVTQEEKQIKIRITDNGAGTEKKVRAFQQGKKVHSLDLIKQRFELLNKVYRNAFQLESTRSDQGCEVHISIPSIKNHENYGTDEGSNY